MKFALITEGPSEHRVIKCIVTNYLKDHDPEINQIQPKMVDNKQSTPGGWNEVLKYCERDEIEDILIENDYLIIQIDTDQSQTKPFNVNHVKESNLPKSPEELYNDVRDKLRSLIKPQIWEAKSDKILFAICIHTIECWMLPLYAAPHHKDDINNCLNTLNYFLKKRNLRTIPQRDKNSILSIRSYDNILRNWRNKSNIEDSARFNIGFTNFIDDLDHTA